MELEGMTENELLNYINLLEIDRQMGLDSSWMINASKKELIEVIREWQRTGNVGGLSQAFERFEEGSRTFKMIRNEDESGVSGTGHVLDGVVFPDGKCVIRWRSDSPTTTIFDTFDDFEAVHVKAHPGTSEIVWGDGEIE